MFLSILFKFSMTQYTDTFYCIDNFTGENRCKGGLRFVSENGREFLDGRDVMAINDVEAEQCAKVCADDEG